MTELKTGFEGGTSGAAVTTAAGGLGDAFAAISPTGIVFSNAQKAHGSLSALIAAAGTNQVVGRWAISASKALVRFYGRLTTLPGGTIDVDLLQVDASGGTTAAVFRISGGAGNKARVTGQSGAYTFTESATTFPANTWIRGQLYVEAGSSPTTGKVRLAYYTGDGSGTVYDSGLQSGVNTANSTGLLTNVRGGKYSSANYTGDIYFDDFAVRTDADAVWSDTWVANTPPVVPTPANQDVAAGASVSFTVSPTDDGTIASYAWTVLTGSSTATPTLTGASTATVSFTAPAAGNLVVLQCVVTDDGGLTTTITCECRVPTSGAFTTLALPGIGDAWTNVGGAANGGAALADALDTTYAESPDYTATESERRWRLQPITPRSSLDLTERNLVTVAGGTKKFRLYESNTLRQEWTVPQHTSAADDVFSLSSPGTIGDWGNLWIAEAVTS